MLLNHVMKRIERRHVRTLHNIVDACLILIIIIIIMIRTDVKETVTLEMNRLMNLKI